MKTTLLIIDPQNDFLDVEGAALPVAGAGEDMRKVAEFIRGNLRQIDDIVITLDTHELLDIAHPDFWRLADGSVPAPFTEISSEMVRAGQFLPASASDLGRVMEYLVDLERLGRYAHMIWPVHCQVGTWGHSVAPDVLEACNKWERTTGRPMLRVLKGQNRYVEHYSAVRAEVVDPRDPYTGNNQRLLGRLRMADRILVAGEALSHCVKATVEQVVANLDGQRGQKAKRVTLLTDAMSPVTGFEAQGQEFLEKMREAGATLTTAAQA